MKHKQAILGAAFAAVLLLGGCSGSETEAGHDDAGMAVPKSEQGSVKVGDTTISSEAKRPPNFPDTILLPKDAVIVASMENGDGSSMVVFDVKQPFETVVQQYETFLADNGYTETMPVMEDEQTYWFAGSRDKDNLVIVLSKNQERSGWSSGSLTYKKSS